jgi:hypothetical protein
MQKMMNDECGMMNDGMLPLSLIGGGLPRFRVFFHHSSFIIHHSVFP